MFSNLLFCKNVINYSTNLRVMCQPQLKNVKCTKYILCKLFHTTQSNVFRVANARKVNEKKYLDVPKIITNIQNNVILYKNEKTREFLTLKLIFYGWLCFNITLTCVTYNSKYITTWSRYKSWKEYFMQNGTNFMYFMYSISIGPLFLAILYQLNKRIIKYIILHKGGAQISLILNHVYKKNYTLTVPVDKVKVTTARTSKKIYIPLKIHNKKFFYLVDGQGKFLNDDLFDYTLGTQKNW